MNRNLLVIGFVVLILASTASAAISSKEAVKFIAEENHFLYSGEEIKQPNFTITHNKKEYWVIPVMFDDTPVTFFAVKASTKELSDEKLVNSSLFKTADLLLEYSKQKEFVSKNTQIQWVITGTYAKIFENLARFLSEEKNELNIVATTLEKVEVSSDIAGLKNSLDQMAGLSQEISEAINEATKFEGKFTTAPDTDDFKGIKDSFQKVFSAIERLEKKALDYRVEVSKVKQAISLLDKDPQTKSGSISYLDPPEKFNDIGNIALDSIELKQSIDGIYTKVSSGVENLLNEFDSRKKRNNAWNLLYTESEDVLKVNEEFTSLSKAVKEVLAEDTKDYWKNQTAVADLEKDWKKAETAFNKADYDTAIQYAENTVKSLKSVYKDGFIEVKKPELLSQELITQLITGLIVLLVILYVFNNREKLFKKDDSDGGKLELSNWQEKV